VSVGGLSVAPARLTKHGKGQAEWVSLRKVRKRVVPARSIVHARGLPEVQVHGVEHLGQPEVQDGAYFQRIPLREVLARLGSEGWGAAEDMPVVQVALLGPAPEDQNGETEAGMTLAQGLRRCRAGPRRATRPVACRGTSCCAAARIRWSSDREDRGARGRCSQDPRATSGLGPIRCDRPAYLEANRLNRNDLCWQAAIYGTVVMISRQEVLARAYLWAAPTQKAYSELQATPLAVPHHGVSPLNGARGTCLFEGRLSVGVLVEA